MGVLNGLLSLFGGGDAASRPGGQPHTDHQSHGRHWTTVLPDDDAWVDRVESMATLPVEEGVAVASEREGVEGHRYDDGPLGVVSVTNRSRLVTSFPVLSGTEHAFHASGLRAWESGVEAWVHGELGPATLGVFPTNYFARDQRAFGGECEVSLSGFLYDAGPRESDTLSTDVGDFDVSEMATALPVDDGAPDDYHVRTVVEDVTAVDGELFTGYLLDAPLYRVPDGEDVTATLFLGSHLADGYEPAPGDSLAGAGWLQARFLERP